MMARRTRISAIAVVGVLLASAALALVPLEYTDNSNPAKTLIAVVMARLDATGHAVPISNTDTLPASTPAISGFGRLSVTASALASTATVGPNSAAWPTSPGLVIFTNNVGSATAYICPLAGACASTTGIPIWPGTSRGVNKPSTDATLVSDGTSTVIMTW